MAGKAAAFQGPPQGLFFLVRRGGIGRRKNGEEVGFVTMTALENPM